MYRVTIAYLELRLATGKRPPVQRWIKRYKTLAGAERAARNSRELTRDKATVYVGEEA